MKPTDMHGMARAEIAREWIARARALKPMLEAAAPRIEDARTLPPDVLSALHDAKMFRMFMPRSVGGAELEPAILLQVVAAIAEGDASAAWCIGQTSACALSAAYLEPRVAQEIFADPAAVHTWGFASVQPPCRAVQVEGGWKVSGTWNFASGNRLCKWIGGHCQLWDESGTPLKNADGRILERTMIFPRSSAKVREDLWEVIGLCGTGSDSYSVTDLFVPTEYSLVPRATGRDQQLPEGVRGEPEPERREKGTLYRFSMQGAASGALSGVGIGIARATLDAFIALAKKKAPVTGNQSLRDDAWIQARIAQADAKLSSATAWLVQLLTEAWDGYETAGEIGFDLRVKLRSANTHAMQMAREVVDMVYLEAGATAIFRSNPFERRLRDIYTVSQQMQGSIARMQSVGQYHLGLKPAMFLIP